uniref:Uncharacterized protein n=1 Tax=Ananas comosus var. bracteatus TaxID=296719 RepID=A0A6V7NY92_ANACO|nr:unnamed protein product [Ananas comosus var. bracteatus]
MKRGGERGSVRERVGAGRGVSAGARAEAQARVHGRTRRRSCGARVSLASRSSPVGFCDLDADDFWHPLNKQHVALAGDPGLDEIVKALLGNWCFMFSLICARVCVCLGP